MSPTSYQAALPRSQVVDCRHFLEVRQSSLRSERNSQIAQRLFLGLSIHQRKFSMTSNQTWVVKYKLPGDQVRTPREIIVTAISQSDAKKVAQAMIPCAIILGGPQPVR